MDSGRVERDFFVQRVIRTSVHTRGCKPKPAELIRLLRIAESSGKTMRHMDDRLCDTSTMSRKKPKTCHIGRHFIKVPQTVAWGDSQHRGLDQFRGFGLRPPSRLRVPNCPW
jgi:hypothetical protein